LSFPNVCIIVVRLREEKKVHACLKQIVNLILEVLRLKNKETDMRFKSTIFSKLMKAIPRREFATIVSKYSGDYRVRRMNCWDQIELPPNGRHRNKLLY